MRGRRVGGSRGVEFLAVGWGLSVISGGLSVVGLAGVGWGGGEAVKTMRFLKSSQCSNGCKWLRFLGIGGYARVCASYARAYLPPAHGAGTQRPAMPPHRRVNW